MLRFLLFRFLPRRILPLLIVFEIVQLVQQLRRSRRLPETEPRPVQGTTRNVSSRP